MAQSLSQKGNIKPKIIPLTYVLKYEPPLIGMVYKNGENDPKKRIYKIYLHGLIYKNDPESITNQLLQEHALQLNGAKVSKEQVSINSLLINLKRFTIWLKS